MAIQELAALYVNYVEPALRVLFFLVVVIVVLHIFHIVKGGKPGEGFASKSFGFMINGLVTMIKSVASGAWWSLKSMLKVITILFATVRDFFVSKI